MARCGAPLASGGPAKPAGVAAHLCWLASLASSLTMVDTDALLAAPIATADSTTTLKETLAGKKTLLLFVRNFA